VNADVLQSAQGYARSPLGIIALFIVLVHGFASLVVALSGNLSEAERWPIIIFLVAFPVLVLAAFCWLVAKHHRKLYGPGDFKDERNFLQYVTTAVNLGVAEEKKALAEEEASKSFDKPEDSGAQKEDVPPPAPIARRSSEDITAAVVASLEPRAAAGSLQGKTVLWVDDRPENNTSEAGALRGAGLIVVAVTNTDDAIRQLKLSNFSVVITDLGRGLDRQAGYDLIARMKAEGINRPVIIYAGRPSERDLAEAKEKGAVARVYSPTELFRLVIEQASRH